MNAKMIQYNKRRGTFKSFCIDQLCFFGNTIYRGCRI